MIVRTVIVCLLITTCAAVALLLHPLGIIGKNIWPASDICPLPTPGQYPFFVILAVIEAWVFGVGVAFIIWGYRFVKFFCRRWQRLAVYIGLSWQMTNWAFHDGMHQVAGIDLNRILYIEYGFHVTLIATTCTMTAAIIAHQTRTIC